MFRIRDQDWDWIQIQSGQRIHIRIWSPDPESGSGIRIQESKNDSQKQEKIKQFHVLKCRMFSFKEKPLALNREYPALQNRKKTGCGLRIRIRMCIRIPKPVVRIWISESVPKCHRSTTLALGMLIPTLSRTRSRIRILIQICKSVVRIRGSGTVPKFHGSTTHWP